LALGTTFGLAGEWIKYVDQTLVQGGTGHTVAAKPEPEQLSGGAEAAVVDSEPEPKLAGADALMVGLEGRMRMLEEAKKLTDARGAKDAKDAKDAKGVGQAQ
jgi:hypothetical protein